MEHFTPWQSLIGGLLIGLASVTLLVFNGRIAGISGIVGSALSKANDGQWRWAFIFGLVAGGFLIGQYTPESYAYTIDRSTPALIAAGLLAGVGTRMGGGCTSGHGVCGISRFSKRSITAVFVFMATAAITVWAVNLGGGAL